MKKIFSACSALIMCAGVMCLASGSVYGAPNQLQNITREEAGATVSDNFYCYANFEKLKEAEIPYNEDYLMPDPDWTQFAISDIIDEIVENKDSYSYGSNEQKIAALYAQVTDPDARNSAEIDILMDIIKKVENAATIDEFIAVSAEAAIDYDVSSIMPFRIDAGVFDSSKYHAAITPMTMMVEPEEFFERSGTAENVQRTYRKVIEKMGGEDSALRAKNTTDMIIDIADHATPLKILSFSPELYAEYSLSELQAMFTADISPYTDFLEQHGERSIVVADVEGFKFIASQLVDENLQAWKDHLVTMIFYKYADYLPDEYMSPLSSVKSGNGFISDMEAKNVVTQIMEKELDYIFASKYADEERIEAAREFTSSIIKAYEGVIENSEGLDETAKAVFKKKLENCEVNIDVPHEPYKGNYEWKPTEKGGSLIENIVLKNRGENADKYNRLGTPFVRSSYEVSLMTSFTYNNACYNEADYVTIPYATICEPFFSTDESLAYNLGRLGFIVGHEISHSFDSTGMNYNSSGNIDIGWVGDEYSALLEQKKADITALYDSQKLFGIYPVNGERTLGENMADIASCQVMLSMLDTNEEKQEFMETFAKGWFFYQYDTSVFDMLNNDEHSPELFRVNTVLSQMDDFYEVYGITEGNMYVAPADRRRVW